MSDVLNEPWLQERPYVQGFALVLGIGRGEQMAYGLSETPFYFAPLQQFENTLRKEGLVPKAERIAASLGMEGAIASTTAGLAEEVRTIR